MKHYTKLDQAMIEVSVNVRQGRRVSIARHSGVWWVKGVRV